MSVELFALLVAVLLALVVGACVDWQGFFRDQGGQLPNCDPVDPCLGCQVAHRLVCHGHDKVQCASCGCFWLGRDGR